MDTQYVPTMYGLAALYRVTLLGIDGPSGTKRGQVLLRISGFSAADSSR